MSQQDMDRKLGMMQVNETMYRTDYIKYDIKETPKTVYVPKHKKPREIPACYLPNYIETLIKWKNTKGVPIDLFVRPNPVRCDPRVQQQPYEKLGDPGREAAQKTRPRLVMTPALSMDDIEDPNVRSLVMKDTYDSTMNSAQRPAAARAFPVDKNVRAPRGNTYAATNPFDLPKLKQPFISPEWRMESLRWDSQQRRGHTLATKEFWLRRPSRGKREN